MANTLTITVRLEHIPQSAYNLLALILIVNIRPYKIISYPRTF
jgi:hypothetical protein